jgi:glycerophosphoryl diester phosphodiesterase
MKKKYILVFILPLFLIGCSSDDVEQGIQDKLKVEAVESIVESDIDEIEIEELFSVSARGELLDVDKSILRQKYLQKKYMFVAHGLGTIGEVGATNTKEALERSYKKGFRLFEVDLSLTSDGKIVVFHDGKEKEMGMENKIGDTELYEFLQKKFLDKYTVMEINELLEFMILHDDMYLVTDTKDDQIYTLNQIKNSKVATKNPNVMDRIIPQIYYQHELKEVLKIYAFPEIIYTLYRTSDTEDQVISFVKNNSEVSAITMRWNEHYNDDFFEKLKSEGVGVYVHTVYDKNKIIEFVNKGVGVYVDDFDGFGNLYN